MRSRTSFLLLLGLALVAARAQPAPDAPAVQEEQPFFARLSDLFTGDLPQIDRPDTIKVTLRPHFGDLVHRDYMRVETGLRWALSESFEVSGDASVFFTHGLADSAGYGIGKLRFGAKYVFERWPKRNYETTLGLNVERPVGHAPVDMTDGQNHFSPSFIIQHPWRRNPHLTTFAGMGVDLISQSRVAGTWGTNQPHDDSVSFTAGGVYDLGQLKWTLTTTYATTALLGRETEHFYYLQPGLLWYVPNKFTFRSKTQWIVGLGARTTWGPDGMDFSLRTRVRAEITFRQVMAHMRERGKAKDAR